MPSDFLTILDQMAASNQIKQFASCTFGGPGNFNLTIDQELQVLALQGQSFFQASGDSLALLSLA
jgi:hypothetical protein